MRLDKGLGPDPDAICRWLPKHRWSDVGENPGSQIFGQFVLLRAKSTAALSSIGNEQVQIAIIIKVSPC